MYVHGNGCICRHICIGTSTYNASEGGLKESTYVYVYVYVYVKGYICMYICMYMYIYMYVQIYAYIYVCIIHGRGG